jgi:membrane protease YdiL (CAAX protease family)
MREESEGVTSGREGVTAQSPGRPGTSAPLPQITVWPTPVPWTGPEVLLALCLIYVAWPITFSLLLQGSVLYRWFYGPDPVARQTVGAGASAGPGAAKTAEATFRRLDSYRKGLWLNAVAFPFQALTIPVLLYSLSGTRPYQLGLTRRRLGRNLLVGFIGALVLVPCVFGVYYLVILLYRAWGTAPAEEHPLTQVAQLGLSPVEWGLLVVSAVVAAPVVEELVFRGLLQPWFAKRREGGALAMALAFLMALAMRRTEIEAALSRGPWAVAGECLPALFVLALVPVYLFVWWRSRTHAGPAIFGTAVLFAAFHSSVWPSPVPLLVLALGLGYLAYRAQSLAAPMLIHALFNGFNCVLILLTRT